MKLKNIAAVSATLIFTGLFLFTSFVFSQAIPFDSDRWEINADESKVTEYLGRKSLLLRGGQAIVKNSNFTDGIIEFDIAFADKRSFMGAVWHWQDTLNFEEFYIRPHRSGFFDANQYQPIFNGNSAWQLFSGDGFGVPVKYEFNKWIPVKIAVSARNAEIYIKDMDNPVLFVSELKRGNKTGKVGLTVNNNAPAYYSNFKLTPVKNLKLKSPAQKEKEIPVGTITNWMVSDLLEEKSLEGKYRLTASDKQNLSWKKLEVDIEGIANLARLQGFQREKNTVFAKIIIQSNKEQFKKFKFGYSDRAKVYFNDRLIYGGINNFNSRDPRFLGTIGLFDELYLPLKKGENELWIAVSETFGGWGVMGLFEDLEGIKVSQ